MHLAIEVGDPVNGVDAGVVLAVTVALAFPGLLLLRAFPLSLFLLLSFPLLFGEFSSKASGPRGPRWWRRGNFLRWRGLGTVFAPLVWERRVQAKGMGEKVRHPRVEYRGRMFNVQHIVHCLRKRRIRAETKAQSTISRRWRCPAPRLVLRPESG